MMNLLYRIVRVAWFKDIRFNGSKFTIFNLWSQNL